ncbi:MAG TPA: chitobiase/beta-hexosaminidase C-terminal domain-containing protein [Opitutaceae bacterium]|nr:chitobiase/beta-hexosaminidase C-terminal domain-containing protein [Opitutaceae bacterium]
MPDNSVVQWQGDLVVKSLTGDDIAVKQNHQITISSFLIIDITKSGGTHFIILGTSDNLGAYTIGTSIRMTTIMNNKTGVVDIYFNGSHVGSKSGGLGGGGMYDKCGAYVSRSGTGGLDNTWVNLKFWIGGTTSGGSPPSAPVFSPAPGSYSSAQSVTITSSGSTSIHYTTDGSTPTASSTTYSGPVALSSTTTLSAIGVNSTGSSPVTSGVYTIILPPPSAPVFSPAPGTYSSTQAVTITSSGSTSIHYTTDGSTPTASSPLYSGPVTISAPGATLSAIGVNSGGTSPVISGVYTITSPPPTFNFEAESLSPVGTGATVSISNDANASGGVVEFLNSTAAGQIMTFTTPSIPVGTYQIQLRYWGNVTRGQHTVKIDGNLLGGTIDQYATSKTYVTVTLGNVTFTSPGTHTIAMTVTGKRSAATQFYLTADKFTFVGQ